MTSAPGDFNSAVEQAKAAKKAAHMERPRGAHRPDRIINEAASLRTPVILEIQRVEEALRDMIRSALEYLENHHVPPRHAFSSRRGWIIESFLLHYEHQVTRTYEVRNSDYPVGYPNDFAIPAFKRVTETFTEWSADRMEGYALCTDGNIYTFYNNDSPHYHLSSPLSPRRVLGIDLSDPLSPKRVQNLDSLRGPNGAAIAAAIAADWLGIWYGKLVQLAARDGADPTSSRSISIRSRGSSGAARASRPVIIESGWWPLK